MKKSGVYRIVEKEDFVFIVEKYQNVKNYGTAYGGYDLWKYVVATEFGSLNEAREYIHTRELKVGIIR